MRTPAFLLMLAASAALGAVPPAPQLPSLPDAAPAMRIADFQPGPVRCGRLDYVPVRMVAPLPVAAAVDDPVPPIRFAFRIDGAGRPLGIHRLGEAPDPALEARDLEPALTAWRFEPGRPEESCEIAFTVRLAGVEEADPGLLYRYAALGRMQLPDTAGGALVRQALAQLRPAGSTCLSDPMPRAPISLPFQSIPEIPGGMSWTFFSYDVDAAGQPVHVRLLASSGNRLLDMAGDVALGGARFPPEPRSGCLYYFFRFSTETMLAPPEPETDFHPPGSACAADTGHRVAEGIAMTFPLEFTRRRAEGWVLFRYDVDASGALRSLRVTDSEPAARFGEEVMRAAASVQLPAGTGAQRDCIQRVRFRLPPR